VPTKQDVVNELARMQTEHDREELARQKAHDMHGGDNAMKIEKRMPEIIAQFGEWAVTPFGVECLVHPYQIQWDSLLSDVIDDVFWLEKVSKYSFVNLHDFADAIRVGRQIHSYLHREE
jgi:hypothetical protein